MATRRQGSRFRYLTQGTCCTAISFRVVNGRIRGLEFKGGCRGNTTGICRLAEGADPGDIRRRLKGIDCGGKGTSCPDQLSRAISAWQAAAKR